jgi:hypothetical protein
MSNTPPPKRRRTAAELWQHLVDEAGEDLINEAAAVTPEQAAKELAEAGFDLDAEKKAADQFLEDLRAGRLPGMEPKGGGTKK